MLSKKYELTTKTNNMATIVSKTTTYEFPLTQIKALICQDLGFKEEAVTIEAIQTAIPDYDLMDRGPTRYEVTGIKVTVNNLA